MQREALLANAASKKISITMKINNLSDKENTIRLVCQTSPSLTVAMKGKDGLITMPPYSIIEKNFPVEISAAQPELANLCHITFSGSDGNGLSILPLDYAVRLVSNDLSVYRNLPGEFVDVDLHKLDQWNTRHIFAGGNAKVFTTPEGYWGMQASFKEYKKIRTWAAPLYPFTQYASILKPSSVILIRGKLKESDNIIQLLMYESDGTRYETKLPINDRNCKGWQTMPVYYSDFQRSRRSFDENQNLDLEEVNKIGIGVLCPHAQEMQGNELLISDFCIVNKKR